MNPLKMKIKIWINTSSKKNNKKLVENLRTKQFTRADLIIMVEAEADRIILNKEVWRMIC